MNGHCVILHNPAGKAISAALPVGNFWKPETEAMLRELPGGGVDFTAVVWGPDGLPVATYKRPCLGTLILPGKTGPDLTAKDAKGAGERKHGPSRAAPLREAPES